MPVEDTAALMADIAVAMAGTLAGMPLRPMFEEDTMALLFAAGVVIALLETRAATRAMQGAHIMPLAAVTGEVTGHIRTTDIRGRAWVIMAWAMAIHTMAITVTGPVGGTFRITHIILTDTDTGPI
jgi:NAD(P)-dependent dehydrogenase (short-subunit alcohol dehydrogenase family)